MCVFSRYSVVFNWSICLSWCKYHTALIIVVTVFWLYSFFKSVFAIFRSVQSLSCVRLSVTPWIAACQASLSITNSQSLPKLMSSESVMPSSHLILCHPLLLLHPTPPSIRVFSNESTLRTRWPKYWSFNFIISPSNEHPGLISFRMDWLDLLCYLRFFVIPYEFYNHSLNHCKVPYL